MTFQTWGEFGFNCKQRERDFVFTLLGWRHFIRVWPSETKLVIELHRDCLLKQGVRLIGQWEWELS